MDEVTPERQPGLRREQKIGFVLLLIFAILSITLGAIQIRNVLYKPFALKDTVPMAYKDEVTGIDSLRFRDTDGDGLNDFDELYVYGTSPYLADTDSDGLTDKQEIDRGGDPLCPTGRDCTNPIISGEGVMKTVAVSTTVSAASAPPSAPDVLQILRDPKQLRPLLVQSGMKPDLLDKISDADLMLLVNQLLQSTSTAGINLQNLLSPLSAGAAAR
ncbi:MAG: hypothetical protein HY983_02685 [Candidatus Magasanikbacteria bacterium]|nr:hypothetical protein [Candidatus Magasanikbacteria bacterium]